MIATYFRNAMFAHNQLALHNSQITKSVRRISSGYRINSAADDPAGLGVSEKMRGAIRGLKAASRNAQDMISMLQTADGGLNETHAMLQRMRELALQASSGTLSDQDRKQLDIEYQAMREGISQISSSTHYNGIKLLDGSVGTMRGDSALQAVGLREIEAVGNVRGEAQLELIVGEDGAGTATLKLDSEEMTVRVGNKDTGAVFLLKDGKQVEIRFGAGKLESGSVSDLVFYGQGQPDLSGATGINSKTGITSQIGASGGESDSITVHIEEMSSSALNLNTSNILTRESAEDALTLLDDAINRVSSQRAAFGANVNRLEHTINSLENAILNLTEAESKIRDVDIAEEMMNYAKHTILAQTAQAMMSHSMDRSADIVKLLTS